MKAKSLILLFPGRAPIRGPDRPQDTGGQIGLQPRGKPPPTTLASGDTDPPGIA